MKISVALCTYNGEKFLSEQLESILQQSVKPNEIIICDDGSKDSTVKILKNSESNHSNIIQVHQNAVNLGFVKNFEKAISLCLGEIIFLSDQDDIWKENKIERFIETFENNPDCTYVFSNAEATDEIGGNLEYSLWNSVKFTPKKQREFNDGFQKELLIKKLRKKGICL